MDFKSNDNSFNETETLNILNTTASVQPLKGRESLHFLRNTYSPRQVKTMTYKQNYGDDNSAKQNNIKVVLDLRSEKDIYDDHYDDRKYYNYYRGRNENNGPINVWNINSEIVNNFSKPVTRTLRESKKRKRCTHILSSVGRRSSELNNYRLLNSNVNPTEIQNGDSRLKQINDDYLINVLKQLIDKVNRNKDLNSTRHQNLPIRTSNGLENKLRDNKSMINSLSEEDKEIFKLDKLKGNRIIDKLNSSSEKTFVNEKWLKNKITKNYKPIVNDNIISKLNSRNESVTRNDTRLFFDLKAESVTETNDEISKNSNTLQVNSVVSKPAENKEVLTTPLPAVEKNRVLVSRDTINPFYLSSTAKLDSTITTDENNKRKYTTRDFTDEDDKEDLLDVNYTDRILDTNVNENDNLPNVNYSDGPAIAAIDDSSSIDNENNSFDNGQVNCNCNKNVIKNILSSAMIINMTEIKSDTYESTANKTKGYKHSDKSRDASNGGGIDRHEHPVGENNAMKNKNNFFDNKVSTHTKPLSRKISSRDGIVAELKLKRLQLQDQIKRNNEERSNNFGEAKIKSKSNDSSLQTAQRQIAAKQYNPGTKEIRVAENTLGEIKITNKIAVNRKMFTTSERPKKIIVSDNNLLRNTPKTIILRENGKFGDNSKYDVNIKLKHDYPINSKTYTANNFSKHNNGGFGGVTEGIASVPVNNNMPQVSTGIKKTFSQTPRKFPDGDATIKESSRNASVINAGKIAEVNVIGGGYNKKIQKDGRNNSYNLGTVKSDDPTRLNENTDGIEMIKTIPANIKTKWLPAGGERPIGSRAIKRPALKSKKSPDDDDVNVTRTVSPAAPVFFDKSIPGRDVFNAPALKYKNVRKTGSNLAHDVLSSKSNQPGPRARGTDGGDREHAPYDAGYLRPIAFGKPAKSDLTNSTVRSGFRRPPSAGHSSGNPSRNRRPPSLQRWSAPVGRPANGTSSSPPATDGGGDPAVIDDGHDIISDHGKYSGDNRGWRDTFSNNRTQFDVLRNVKVTNGVFKIPLVVSRTSVGANGTARVSGVFIPVEKHDGRHSAVSLSELLTGDFRLPDDVADPAALQASRSDKNDFNDVTAGGPFDSETSDNIIQRASNEVDKAPVQIIQIINNGLCLDQCNVTDRTNKKFQKAAGVQTRNDGKRVLSSPNIQQTRRRIENAYNHFDSEILDRFLQVYTP